MVSKKIEIKPIRTQQDYEKVMGEIESLLNCEENSKEAEVLEVLSILADEYEQQHYTIDAPDAIEAIKYRMEQLNLSKKDLAVYLGGANRVSEVLSRKRPLTLKMIKALYHHLHIPAETLLAK
jgi:HTH-type transcriptional regulator/antitoxin HigA